MNPLQLFNPSNQSKTELIANFSIRLKEFNRIKKVIENDEMLHAPQHYIIQGVRGSGKTTLLWRLYYEIKKSTKTSLIPIIFNEEQYGLNKLFKLWEQIAKELEAESSNYLNLFEEIQSTDEIEQYEEHSYTHLFNTLTKNGNKICLFWDNIGEFLQKLTKKEQQRLREVLITNNQIRIVGASSEVLESTYKYDEPFYEYFKIVHLKELNKEETIQFLLALDQINKTNKIDQIIKESPGKIEALRVITGGIPRTMVLLYEIFINDKNGDSFKYLEILLDRVTPLYKHRMDDLSTQQQEIVDCIALNWDAMGVKEIAKKTRMESKSISAQLRLLEKNNVILKKGTSTKNHFYQVKERFFNIWYIMRNGRKSDRNKVKWLTKFLELWCDKGSLNEMINTHISKLQSGKVYDKYALDLTEAFAQMVTSYELQHQLLNETKSYLKSSGSNLQSMVSDSDFDYISKNIIPLIDNENFEEAITLLKKRDSNTGQIELIMGMIFSESLNKQNDARIYYLKAIDKKQVLAMNPLAIIYYEEFKDYKMAEKYFLMAIENNDEDAIYNIAFLYQEMLKDFYKAEKYYLLAIEKGITEALDKIPVLYHIDLNDRQNAEKYYLLSIKEGNTNNLYALGFLYQEFFEDYEKAEKYYLLSVKNNEREAMTTLALLYQEKFQDYEKAEKYYLLAIKAGHIGAMNNLGALYGNYFQDYTKAKKYYLLAFEKGDGMAANNLGTLYQEELNNLAKAKFYYQIAIERNSNMANNNLAWLYFEQGIKKSKSKKLAEKAFSLNEEYSIKHTYALILLWNNKIDEAIKVISPLFENKILLDKPIKDFELIINLLIAKKQYNYVYQLFEKNNNQIKDRLKPIYYALMHFMKDEYPDEIKKMGEELNETVDSIVQYILELRETYK